MGNRRISKIRQLELEKAEETESCEEDDKLPGKPVVVSPLKEFNTAATQTVITKTAEKSLQCGARKVAEKSTQSNFRGLPILELPNEKFKTMTGISKNVFDLIVDITAEEIKDSTRFPKKLKIASVFAKLKLNVPFDVIAVFFNVSRQLISQTFTLLMPILSAKLKDFIIWFDKEWH